MTFVTATLYVRRYIGPNIWLAGNITTLLLSIIFLSLLLGNILWMYRIYLFMLWIVSLYIEFDLSSSASAVWWGVLHPYSSFHWRMKKTMWFQLFIILKGNFLCVPCKSDTWNRFFQYPRFNFICTNSCSIWFLLVIHVACLRLIITLALKFSLFKTCTKAKFLLLHISMEYNIQERERE